LSVNVEDSLIVSGNGNGKRRAYEKQIGQMGWEDKKDGYEI
jgi:hypothetical protein